MSQVNNKSVFVYELIEIVFIIILGSVLHFTFEWSGSYPVVGFFSAVNESVWEHLKLAFWPALLYLLIEYGLLRRLTSNFFLAKTSGVCLMIIIIPAIFYSYTAVIGKSILAIDISTFAIAVIIGQLSSYKLLTHRKLSENLNRISLIVLILLALAFVLFTFHPPQLPIFQDPNTGEYGILW
jgi:hypothetical protein